MTVNKKTLNQNEKDALVVKKEMVIEEIQDTETLYSMSVGKMRKLLAILVEEQGYKKDKNV